MNTEYKDYYKNHIGYNADLREQYLLKYYKDNFSLLLQDLNIKTLKVLEIGCGKGLFATYCLSMNVGQYLGFDLDEQVIAENQGKFIEHKNYTFSREDVLDSLKEGDFDVVFMSHVFEHLDREDAALYARFIYSKLKQGGIFINVMPNAGSLFSSSIGRYADNTHRILYTEVSFHQVLAQEGFSLGSISSRNSLSGPFILRFLRKVLKAGIRGFIALLGYPTSAVDTFEIITVAKK